MTPGRVAPPATVPWSLPVPEDATLIRRAAGGGVLVETPNRGRRWVPDHWVVDGLDELKAVAVDD